MKPVITLTSDLGSNSMYVATVKGKILQQLPDAAIIDISHEIRAQNSMEAAFVLKNSYQYFPKRTVHVIEVNSLGSGENTEGYKYLAAEYNGHFFVGADNGIFSIIFDDAAFKSVELTGEKYNLNTTFPMRDIFADAACDLLKNNNLENIGRPNTEIKRLTALQPVSNDSTIKATVIFTDKYENLFINIRKDFFNSIAKGRRAIVDIKGERIEVSERGYSEVGTSYAVCFFNSFGYLEVAVNQGNAKGLFGLRQNDSIIIEFE